MRASKNVPRDRHRVGILALRVRKEDRKLIPAQPRDKCVLGHTLSEPLSNSDEKGITGRVAMRVIDRLEAVEVEKQH